MRKEEENKNGENKETKKVSESEGDNKFSSYLLRRFVKTNQQDLPQTSTGTGGRQRERQQPETADN